MNGNGSTGPSSTTLASSAPGTTPSHLTAALTASGDQAAEWTQWQAMSGNTTLTSIKYREVQSLREPTHKAMAWIRCTLEVVSRENLARGSVFFWLPPDHPFGASIPEAVPLVYLKFDVDGDFTSMEYSFGLEMKVLPDMEFKGPLKNEWNMTSSTIYAWVKVNQDAQTCLNQFGLAMASGESLEAFLLEAVDHTAEEGYRRIGGR